MIYILACFLFLGLISCQSPKVKIISFNTSDSIINEGSKTYLNWEVKNADSIVLKQLGSDDLLLENAPLKSRMAISPAFSTEFTLTAYNGDEDSKSKCSLSVIVKPPLIKTIHDTIKIVKPIVEVEPSKEKSKYIKGLQTIENLDKTSKINYEIFFIDRLNFPKEVKLYVTVKDENGNFIANLAQPFGTKETSKKYFLDLSDEVNGKKHNISEDEYDIEERHDTLSQKYSFSLVLDHSGSMVQVIDILHKSVKQFITKMEKSDKTSIVKFDHIIERTLQLTNDKQQLLNPTVFNGLNNFGGGTALIAASDEGIRSLNENKTVKIEILFTDGAENSSFVTSLLTGQGYSYKPKSLIYKAREENVKIFTIGFGNVDKDLLEKISSLTDGKSYYANNGNELEQIFNELPRIFHNYYIITFKPKKIEGQHSFQMTVANPDGSTDKISRITNIGKIDLSDLDNMQKECIAFFEHKSEELKDESKFWIEKISTYLNLNRNSLIEIHGHTDLTGSKEANLELSKKRCESVYREFAKNGVNKARMSLKPHGMSVPIWNPELNEYQSEQNRRVELIIKD
ncbi:MAG: VWA domain-containing protein [Candidatus Kapabacteria bacterium]|nr:VWA domain-containing protein [Candidatus Kapabacteria bacterium]